VRATDLAPFTADTRARAASNGLSSSHEDGAPGVPRYVTVDDFRRALDDRPSTDSWCRCGSSCRTPRLGLGRGADATVMATVGDDRHARRSHDRFIAHAVRH
jgi:hypothetical protein